MRWLARTILPLLITTWFFSGSLPADPPAGGGEILVINVKGVINPITEEYFARALKDAANRRARLLLVEMDTPGGLMESMWAIIQGIVNSKVPVAVYVCPPGAHAASAGTFILMAAHVAAMAPSTTIGAAHPVGITPSDGEKDTSMQKVVNDAVTRMRQNAQRHGRNAVWAERAIRESATIGTDDAVRTACADLKAETRERLVELMEGRKVTMGDGGKLELKLKGAPVVSLPMTAREEILHTVSHPNISYLLLLLGITAIGFEVTHPGAIFPGVVGVLSIALAFLGLKYLPINYIGLLLILFSFVFFILELKLATSGLLTMAGIIAMAMGSVFLIDSPLPSLQVSKVTIGAVVGSIGLLFLFVISKIVNDMSRPPATGLATMVGLEGYAAEPFAGEGLVKVAGEFWKARVMDGGTLDSGARVRVVAVDQKCLTVERLVGTPEPPRS